MRVAELALLVATLSLGTAGVFAHAEAGQAKFKQEHPGNVALIEDSEGFTYRLAATGFRLYVSDRDAPNKSNCIGGCASAWVPLEVSTADSKPVGDWTIFKRDDGKRQWAYRGRPVYTLFHDSAERPIGNGVEGKWHYLEP